MERWVEILAIVKLDKLNQIGSFLFRDMGSVEFIGNAPSPKKVSDYNNPSERYGKNQTYWEVFGEGKK